MPAKARPQLLFILGTRPMSVEIADLVADVPAFKAVGFVDNEDNARCGHSMAGLPVHWVDEMARYVRTHRALCGLMTTHRARFTDQVEALGMRFATLVHPMARVSSSAQLGHGCIVSAGAVIGAEARLGRHVFVNRGALIGHHTEVGDHASLGPGANVAGHCLLGERVYVGIGAIVNDHVSIGERSVIGAGALVMADLPDRVTAVGAPAKVIKQGGDGK